ncbi:VOC family protein [Pluralibacter gergoviae]|nr:VOC family protein [Pluralibacter gergoviae]ELK5591754.1 VOC family protein [Pluralibacter gergoviae]MDU4436202.1 VOC family protein [Pluralibacter gergoviae]
MLRCSHILCKVSRIDDCVRDLELAGFSVQRGGAHNALVWFEQGPFLELFELPGWCRPLSLPFGLRFGRSAGRRLAFWAGAGEGWCDVALEPRGYRPDDPLHLDDIHRRLRALAPGASRIINGSRNSAGGGRVRYRFMTAGDRQLPFIVSHYHPPQRPERVRHANGARSVARVDLHLPATAHAALGQLLPEDTWLKAHIGERSLGVTLAGWRALPQTSRFIRRLFSTTQEP